jgi:hypothetical protein
MPSPCAARSWVSSRSSARQGADPRRYRRHDKEQWEKLKSLSNLLYTDGNAFSLWQNGEFVGSIVELSGDIETLVLCHS